MKRILLTLLITLTALRGLVGDVMATEMSAMMTSPVSAQSEQIASAQPTMPCHSAEDETPSVAALPGCKTCQVCHLSAFVMPSMMQVEQSVSNHTPVVAFKAFVSAEADLLIKPPIS